MRFHSHRAALLILAIMVAMTLTGCSDDDDGITPPISLQTTYTASPNVSGQPSTLIVTVTSTLPATGAGVFSSGGESGSNASGLLLIGDDDRVDMAGTYDMDKDQVDLEGGGYSFMGSTTRSSLMGTLTLPDTSTVAVTGEETMSNAPLEGLLGTWSFSDTSTENCDGDIEQFTCSGYFRVRLDNKGITVIDLNEMCAGEPDECELAAVNLDEGTWAGNTYSHSINGDFQDGPCSVVESEDLEFTLSGDTLTYSFDSTCVYTGAECIDAGTCAEVGSGSASRCTGCWPRSCN